MNAGGMCERADLGRFVAVVGVSTVLTLEGGGDRANGGDSLGPVATASLKNLLISSNAPTVLLVKFVEDTFPPPRDLSPPVTRNGVD